jgi:hypothetical protein
MLIEYVLVTSHAAGLIDRLQKLPSMVSGIHI